jgi:AsmA protein
MKWLVRVVVVLLVLALGLWLILPRLISKEDLVARAETEATSMLGREVSIGEVTGISLFPPRITVRGLEVANAEGFDDPYLARVEEARLGVALMPLLSSRVEIETFSLDEPTIYLATRADGSNNYTLGAEDTGEAGTGDSGSDAVVVGDLTISEGRLTYRTPDADYAVEALNAELKLPERGDDLTLDAGMRLEGIETAADLRISDFWTFAAEGRGEGEASIDLGGNAFEGRFAMGLEPFSLEGPITISLGQPSALEPLVGAETVEAFAPFGDVTVAGTANVTEERLAFEGATFNTAVAAGAGDLTLVLTGARPRLEGRVRAQRADLTPFFPEEDARADAPEDAPFPAWSEETIDFSGLTAFDADLEVNAEEIVVPTYTLRNVAGAAVIDNGRVRLGLDRAETLGGSASGALTLNAAAANPEVATDFTFADVDFAEAGPALLGTKRLIGRGTLRFDVTTQGKSQASWVENLGGQASVGVSGGRILGIDLNLLAQTALELIEGARGDGLTAASLVPALADLTTRAAARGAETQFDVANFNADIVSGRTNLTEAQLRSDTFRATIGGAVNLPEQAVDLRILLAAKPPAATGYNEFIAPVAVRGSFSDPSIAIDPQPIINTLVRGQANKVLEGTGIELKEGENVGDALRNRAQQELFNLLGGRKKPETDAPAPQGEETGEEPPRR